MKTYWVPWVLLFISLLGIAYCWYRVDFYDALSPKRWGTTKIGGGENYYIGDYQPLSQKERMWLRLLLTLLFIFGSTTVISLFYI